MTPITSSDNPRFRELLGLAESGRARRAAGLTFIDGLHLLETYLPRQGVPQQLVVTPESRQRPAVMALLARLPGVPCLELSDGLFRRLSTVHTPTGILGLIRLPEAGALPSHPEACVLLDGVQDPGNLGSILRSTAAAGLRQVYLSPPVLTPGLPGCCGPAWARIFSCSASRE